MGNQEVTWDEASPLISERIRTHPREVTELAPGGWLPIHFAKNHGAPEVVHNMLIAADPNQKGKLVCFPSIVNKVSISRNGSSNSYATVNDIKFVTNVQLTHP